MALYVCKSLSSENIIISDGSVRTLGNITSNSIITGNTISIADSANLGGITQISTQLLLSSTGNKVAIASDNLLFKNDNSAQLTAYTGHHKVDPIYLHGLMQNRTIIKQTISLQNPSVVWAQVGYSGRLIFINLGNLIKNEVIVGAFFWLNGSSTTCHIGLYPQVDNAPRVASTATNAAINVGLNYVNFSSPFTVPTTQIYYLGILVNGGSTLQMLSLNLNNFHNYLMPGIVTGRLAATTHLSDQSFASLPSSIQSIVFRPYLYSIFVGVYG